MKSNYQNQFQMKQKNLQKLNQYIKKLRLLLHFQINLITKRAIKGLLSDKMIIAIFMGLLLGYSIRNYKNIFEQIMNYIYILCINLTMNTLFPVLLQFSTETDVFLREENLKLNIMGNFFQYPSTAFCLITQIIQELILYWIIGLNTRNGGVVFSIHSFLNNGTSMRQMARYAFIDIKVASSIVPLLQLIIFSGFFANSKQFFVLIGWIQYIITYSFEVLATNEFEGRKKL